MIQLVYSNQIKVVGALLFGFTTLQNVVDQKIILVIITLAVTGYIIFNNITETEIKSTSGIKQIQNESKSFKHTIINGFIQSNPRLKETLLDMRSLQKYDKGTYRKVIRDIQVFLKEYYKLFRAYSITQNQVQDLLILRDSILSSVSTFTFQDCRLVLDPQLDKVYKSIDKITYAYIKALENKHNIKVIDIEVPHNIVQFHQKSINTK